jgi:hypothetical protein
MNSMGWRVNAVKDAVFAAQPSANAERSGEWERYRLWNFAGIRAFLLI